MQTSIIRLGGALGCTWLLWVAYAAWIFGGGYENLTGSVLSFCCYALFFITAYLTFRRELARWYAPYFVAALIAAAGAYTYVVIHYRSPGIQTDGLALSLAAAQTALAGHNPYGENLAWAFAAYHLPSAHNTPQADGSVVTTLPYPALAFVLYIPAVLADFDARWISFIGLAVAMLLLAAMAPVELKTLAPLAFVVNPAFLEATINGLQDILYVPLLMLAAYFWIDAAWIAGIFLGLAAAVKQEPWLDAPFFLLGVLVAGARERSSRIRQTALAAAAMLAAFALPNLWYAVMDPAAWLKGVSAPFTQKNVELGVGLVNLSLAGILQLPRWMLVALPAAALIAALVTTYRRFDYVRNAVWLAPGLMLFVAPRSLPSYFVYLIPVVLASWLGQLPGAAEWKRRALRRIAKSLSAAAIVGVLGAFLAGCGQQPQIDAKVVGALDKHGAGLANRLVLDVANADPARISVTYLVAWNAYQQYLWRCASGCGPVGGHSIRRVTIVAPDYSAAVPNGKTIIVRVVDARSGSEFQSDRFAVRVPALHLADPCLCLSEDVGYPAPVGWTVRRSDLESGVVRFTGDGRSGKLTLTVRATTLPGWSSASAAADFIPLDHPIEAGVSKAVLYQSGPSPAQYAGISIADDSGRFVLFAWGDVPKTEVYIGKGVFVVEPARRQRFLRIDYARFARLAGFAPGARYSLRLVVAAAEPKVDLSVDFTGFLIAPRDNEMPDRS